MFEKVLFSIKAIILAILFVIAKILHLLPYSDRLGEDLFIRIANTRKANMKKRNYWHTLFGWRMYSSILYTLYQDMEKKALRGLQAPNPPIVSLEGVSGTLLDQHIPERPLVVVFGSCTCPPFMASLRELNDVMRKSTDVADFVVVYIDEAHADDGWKFKENYQIFQHQTLKERLAAARILQSQKPLAPVFVDTMSNTANIAYAAHPERLYVIHGGMVAYQGGIGPFHYNVEEVSDWLNGYRLQQNHRMTGLKSCESCDNENSLSIKE